MRSSYFAVLLNRFRSSLQAGVPEKIIAFYESKTVKEVVDESKGLISVDLSVPAVFEYVVRYAQRKKCSLHAAVMEVRESKHASKFREWCARFKSLDNKGRAAAMEQNEMVSELRNVCDIWKKDVREGTEYKTRKLNLEKLPLMGGVLKALNMHEGYAIKDPVISPSARYTYFLFLNDLLRPAAG